MGWFKLVLAAKKMWSNHRYIVLLILMKKYKSNKRNRPRLLTPDEADSLLRDMKESSAWMRAEIKRRRAARLINQ